MLVEPLLAVPAPHQEGTAVGEVGRGGALTAAVSQSANTMNHHEVVMFYAEYECLSVTRRLVTAHVFGISSLVGSASQYCSSPSLPSHGHKKITFNLIATCILPALARDI